MNEKICDDLVEMGIFESRVISEEAYQKCRETDEDNSAVYFAVGPENSYGNSESALGGMKGNEGYEKWFKRVDTKGLSEDDIRLQLQIEQTKAVKSIKKMVIFFVVVMVIGLVISFISRVALIN